MLMLNMASSVYNTLASKFIIKQFRVSLLYFLVNSWCEYVPVVVKVHHQIFLWLIKVIFSKNYSKTDKKWCIGHASWIIRKSFRAVLFIKVLKQVYQYGYFWRNKSIPNYHYLATEFFMKIEYWIDISQVI